MHSIPIEHEEVVGSSGLYVGLKNLISNITLAFDSQYLFLPMIKHEIQCTWHINSIEVQLEVYVYC